jgi:hypothetical protein
MTDRAAIGGELRYASDSTYSFVYLDYDAAFNSLNTFLASGTWRPTLDTDLRLSIDRRNSPVMTLGSALQGQPVTDLEDLKDTFSESEIRDLAEDRTAVFWSGSIGATQRLDERLQVSGDLTVSHMSGTETSGGVEGADSSGPDIGASIQLMANDWLVEEGVGSISLRYFEGESYRSFLTSTYSRFTLIDDLRVFPRLRWEWRDSEVQGSRSLLRPSLEADWRLAVWRLNAEAGIEWEEPISGDGTFEELTYFIELGVRWEF